MTCLLICFSFLLLLLPDCHWQAIIQNKHNRHKPRPQYKANTWRKEHYLTSCICLVSLQIIPEGVELHWWSFAPFQWDNLPQHAAIEPNGYIQSLRWLITYIINCMNNFSISSSQTGTRCRVVILPGTKIVKYSQSINNCFLFPCGQKPDNY